MNRKLIKKPKLDLTTRFEPLQILFQSKVYSNIINPGSSQPFQFDMLSEVEDDYKFDISIEPSSYSQIYDLGQEKLKINFWTLLNFSRKLWLIQMACSIITNILSIFIALCVKEIIDNLALEFASNPALLRGVFWMFVLGLVRTPFHSNFLIMNNLMIASTENVLKVYIDKCRINSKRDFFE